ncbi:hypothetical protein, partial [Fibrobacter intestinalis]|uniref:hypothetical protein n=1 Tax=Fibrobacter intestinalis TaxID=28122 RepID=UPI0023F14916
TFLAGWLTVLLDFSSLKPFLEVVFFPKNVIFSLLFEVILNEILDFKSFARCFAGSFRLLCGTGDGVERIRGRRGSD